MHPWVGEGFLPAWERPAAGRLRGGGSGFTSAHNAWPLLGCPQNSGALGSGAPGSPGPPNPPASTWCPAKRGSSQDGGVVGRRRPPRESRGAWAGPGVQRRIWTCGWGGFLFWPVGERPGVHFVQPEGRGGDAMALGPRGTDSQHRMEFYFGHLASWMKR